MSAVYQDVKVATGPIRILKKIALFKFPRDIESRNEWLKSIPRANCILGESIVYVPNIFLKKIS